MELTKEHREETINNLPKNWLHTIFKLKKGKVSKRTIQRVVLEEHTDLHGILPLAVNMAADNIIKKLNEKKELSKATSKLKKALTA